MVEPRQGEETDARACQTEADASPRPVPGQQSSRDAPQADPRHDDERRGDSRVFCTEPPHDERQRRFQWASRSMGRELALNTFELCSQPLALPGPLGQDFQLHETVWPASFDNRERVVGR